MFHLRTLCIITFTSVAFTTNALAGVIDFSDQTSGSCASYGEGTFTSQGYEFKGNPDEPYMFLCDAGVVATSPGVVLVNANGIGIITMNKVGGGAFTLNSFDAGSRMDYYDATGIDVLGNLVGGGTVSTSFNFDGYNFQTFTLPNTFTNLSSVVLTSMGTEMNREFAINNITVDGADAAVPEPQTVSLVLAALAGLPLVRRFRR